MHVHMYVQDVNLDVQNYVHIFCGQMRICGRGMIFVPSFEKTCENKSHVLKVREGKQKLQS